MRSFNPVLLSALAMLTLGDAPPPATATDDRSPPNDLWPVRTHDDIRRGCYVLDVSAWARADWARAGLPRVGPSGGPREAFDPLWDELMSWLAQCPVLVDIETFWVFDADFGHGWQLLVTGIAAKTTVAVRVPTGTIIYDEAPFASLDVPDHGYIDVQVELSPEDAAKIQRERETLSAGYAVIQQPLLVNYIAPQGGRVVATMPCDVRRNMFSVGGSYADGTYSYTIAPRICRSRDQQRAKRKRRAARKRKRGWA